MGTARTKEDNETDEEGKKKDVSMENCKVGKIEKEDPTA